MELEEQELQKLPVSAKANAERYKKSEIIGILKALHAIMLTIFAALIPIAAIVGGTGVASVYADLLRPFVAAETLVAFTIAALFAYGEVFLILRRHEGSRIRAALTRIRAALTRLFGWGSERAG